MKGFIERAAKKAGISGMLKAYPDTPSQRGCEYWSRFVYAIQGEYDELQQDLYRAKHEIATISHQLVSTQRELIEVQRRVVSFMSKTESGNVVVPPPPPTS